MAANRRKKGGRVTPSARANAAPAKAAAPAGRQQIGRRPSSPGYLLLVAIVWIGCGIYAFVGLTASWRLVPAIFFIGVGLFFLRGAAATLLRRSRANED